MADSSSSTVRVAVTQAEPVWFNLTGAVEKTTTLMKEAADNKAQLIAFPEVWIPGYPSWIWYSQLPLASAGSNSQQEHCVDTGRQESSCRL